MAGFFGILENSFHQYFKNLKIISLFSIPFLLAYPLLLMLPNYSAMSGIFLRLGGLTTDISLTALLFIIFAFLASLLLFSFTIVLLNMLIKSLRTINKIRFYDLEKMDSKVFRVFTVYLTGFLIIFIVNLLLLDYNFTSLQPLISTLVSSIVFLALIFIAQGVVVDDLSVWNSIYMNTWVISRDFGNFLLFLVFSAVLLLVNSWIFVSLPAFFPGSDVVFRIMSVCINGLFLLPFLEILKVQIYLNKYTIL